MHDIVKNAVIEITDRQRLKSTIEEIADSINAIMPKTKNGRQLLISYDSTLLSNLQQLLNNAEYYDIDVYRILELRKNLISFYVGLGRPKCQEMEYWFFTNQRSIYYSTMQK